MFDYNVQHGGKIVQKILFIFWSPDSASTKNKMMHASTKDFFKDFLRGVQIDLSASELAEIDNDNMQQMVIDLDQRSR